MKNKKKVTIGIIIMVIGFAQFIAISLFTADKPNLRFLSPLSSGILGACFVAGLELIQRGRDPEVDKQKNIEQHDERNQLIRGKAAYVSLLITDILILFFGAYVSHILGNVTAGLICYGIAVAVWIIYGIAYKAISKKN